MLNITHIVDERGREGSHNHRAWLTTFDFENSPRVLHISDRSLLLLNHLTYLLASDPQPAADLLRGRKTHPKSRNTKKRCLRELFRKVRANFSLLSCDTSQEPNGNCSEKFVQMNLFISEVSKRGWQIEGVGGQRGLARGNPSCARDSDIFSDPFSYFSLRRRWTQFWGTIFAVFGALLVTNPLPPIPFPNF